MRVRQAVVTLVLALAALTAVSTAFAGNGGIAPPDPATASASRISDLWWVLMGILILIFVLVEGALVWFVFRYRRRGRADDAEGPQVHGHTKLELLWTAIPAAILIAVLVITIAMVPTVEAKPKAGTEPLVVDVTAHQFYWEYTYPNGVVAVDTLRLPEGRPVQLVLNAVDVIHSWWVPELQGKRDAIPGRTNTLNFTVARTGTFQGQCAELCGAQHALMPTTVEVVSATEFDGWLDDQAAAQSAGTSELGDETWDGVCAKCHGLDGSGGYGPEIAGNALLVDQQALAKLLAEGRDTPAVGGSMPVISTGWPDKQLKALIDYVSATPGLASATGTGTETSAEGG
jgi:cytochrome c oxidase subunit 2